MTGRFVRPFATLAIKQEPARIQLQRTVVPLAQARPLSTATRSRVCCRLWYALRYSVVSEVIATERRLDELRAMQSDMRPRLPDQNGDCTCA